MTLNCSSCKHPIQAIGKVRANSAVCVPCYIEELTLKIFDLETEIKKLKGTK